MSKLTDKEERGARYERFLSKVYGGDTRGPLVVVPPARGYQQCQHCSFSFRREKIVVHETICLQNPKRNHLRFNSLGKEFIKKLPVAGALPAPELRIAAIQLHGKVYPILLDDVLELHRAVRVSSPDWLTRNGAYLRNRIQILYFQVKIVTGIEPPNSPLDRFHIRVAALIKKAQKAGADL